MVLIFSALLSLNCVIKEPHTKGVQAVGTISSPDSKVAGKPCVGVAKMLADGTLIYYYSESGDADGRHLTKFVYKVDSAGYKGSIDFIGGISPGEDKAIPPTPPSIGVASMSSDGTLSLQLWIPSATGAIGEGLVKISPGEARYEEIVKHISIKPGQVKNIPPLAFGAYKKGKVTE